MAVGCATARVRVVTFDDLAGLGRQMPVTMGALVVGGLVEVAKAVPFFGAPVGIGERLVVEGTRRIEVPPTSTQAIYCNLAALSEEVVDLAPPIRNQLVA